MFQILRRCDQRKGAIATVEFEGREYGAGISFFVGNLLPGTGPGLHKHPYSETCVVLSGRAAMIVDGKEIIAGAGDIVVIEPATLHRFTAIGRERLDMFCIHASDHFVIESTTTQGPIQAKIDDSLKPSEYHDRRSPQKCRRPERVGPLHGFQAGRTGLKVPSKSMHLRAPTGTCRREGPPLRPSGPSKSERGAA